MRFPWGWRRRNELAGLRTRREIDLFIERENARRVRAERRGAEAQVRRRNFELIAEAVLLTLAVGTGVGVIVGMVSNPSVLEVFIASAGAWGAIFATLFRLLRSKSG